MKTKKIQIANKAEITPSPLDWTSEYELSAEEAKEIADPTWIIDNLIISGHIALIPAEPNAGKTTIFMHLAGDMVRQGYQVFYVNSDVSGGDAKPMRKQAIDNNFKLLLPDMKVGLSMNTVIDNLKIMSETNERYDDVVFIYDTLKKMVNVISKEKAKELFKLLRKLSAKGMTSVLLAHTNKYNDNNDHPIYEGTGDMRSDSDDLIYLIPHKNDDGSITVTTDPSSKVRGNFEPITFTIDRNRKVTKQDETIDTIKANEISKDLSKDQAGIDCIKSLIVDGNTNQKQIIKNCKGIGERTVKKLLKQYSPDNDELPSKYHYWNRAKGAGKAHEYSLIN